MELSFGMIFSIILIIVFISFSVYVTIKFLGFQDKVKIENFKESVQNSVNDIWKGTQGKNTVSYALPNSIEKICFFDKTANAKGKDKDFYNLFLGLSLQENLMFYPEASGEGDNGIKIDNINLKNITALENPLCVDNIGGKVTMNLKMNYGESLVTISR